MATNGLAAILEHVDPQVSTILHRALDGEEISWSEGLRLCETNGLDLQAVCLVADEMRRRQVGDVITYVVNRNINFTNVCFVACSFCGFGKGPHAPDAYSLSIDDVVNSPIVKTHVRGYFKLYKWVRRGAEIRDCNGCQRDYAKRAGADWAAWGTVQKVSNLILNINLYMEDAGTGKLTFVKSVDIRGNTDESWRHGLDYMLRNYLFGEP